MRTDFERAYVTAHGNVAVVTLNHPEVMNAASAKLLAGATEALQIHRAAGFGLSRRRADGRRTRLLFRCQSV